MSSILKIDKVEKYYGSKSSLTVELSLLRMVNYLMKL